MEELLLEALRLAVFLIPVGIVWYFYFLRPARLTVLRGYTLSFASRAVDARLVFLTGVKLDPPGGGPSLLLRRLRTGPLLDRDLDLRAGNTVTGDLFLRRGCLVALAAGGAVHYSRKDAKTMWRSGFPFFLPISALLAAPACAIPALALALLFPVKGHGHTGNVIGGFFLIVGSALVLGVTLFLILLVRERLSLRRLESALETAAVPPEERRE